MFSLLCVTLGIQSTNVLPIVTSSQLVAEAFEFTQKTASPSAKAWQRWPGSTPLDSDSISEWVLSPSMYKKEPDRAYGETRPSRWAYSDTS